MLYTQGTRMLQQMDNATAAFLALWDNPSEYIEYDFRPTDEAGLDIVVHVIPPFGAPLAFKIPRMFGGEA